MNLAQAAFFPPGKTARRGGLGAIGRPAGPQARRWRVPDLLARVGRRLLHGLTMLLLQLGLLRLQLLAVGPHPLQ